MIVIDSREAGRSQLVSEGGEGTAPFKIANGERQRGCGELYASHPSSAQGQGELNNSFLLIVFNLV